MEYSTFTLPNGLRIMHIPARLQVAYVGVAIDVGTRDELPEENGMAHLVEHMLFKGTRSRSARSIVNRLESVGGQIDAYTTKEDTYVYSVVPRQYTLRALDLIADIVQNSEFNQKELERERGVIIEEIQSYNDSPSELIYDEFEQLLFPGDPIGRNILGTEETLASFTSQSIRDFTARLYRPQRMVVFMMGSMKKDKFFAEVEKLFASAQMGEKYERCAPQFYQPNDRTVKRDTFQAHVMLGTRFDAIADPQASLESAIKTMFVNNILGGPNLSSRLNLAVRERNGLCYTIESAISSYTDQNVWSIYFGCEDRNVQRALKLVEKELDILSTKPLSSAQLASAKRQIKGQLLISNQNAENVVLSTSKFFLHDRPVVASDEMYRILDSITAADVQAVATQLFNPERISRLIFTEK